MDGVCILASADLTAFPPVFALWILPGFPSSTPYSVSLKPVVISFEPLLPPRASQIFYVESNEGEKSLSGKSSF